MPYLQLCCERLISQLNSLLTLRLHLIKAKNTKQKPLQLLFYNFRKPTRASKRLNEKNFNT